jgi:hypothetical protein
MSSKRTRSNGHDGDVVKHAEASDANLDTSKRQCIEASEASGDAIAADGLQFLLGSDVSMETFFKENWERKSLLTKATPARKEWCQGAFSVDGLWSLLDKHELFLGKHLNMCRLAADGTKETYEPAGAAASGLNESGADGHHQHEDHGQCGKDSQEAQQLTVETGKQLFTDDKYTAQFFQVGDS